MGLWRGRAKFKRRIAELAATEPCQLPFRRDLLDFLSAEATVGRQLILATAADETVAGGVARHLGLFSKVIASDGVVNRKGSGKLEAIKSVADRFIYAGDSAADLPVWKAAEGAIVIGNSPGVLKSLRRDGVTVYRTFPDDAPLFDSIVRSVRVRQWPKNLLVFLPIFLGHRTLDPLVWMSGLLAFVIFCLAASAVYVLNDLLDIEADRQHPEKRFRPFASGDLSIPTGFVLLAALAAAGVGLSLLLPAAARWWLATYFAATLCYSFYLKTRLMADVVGLAMLYALRVMVGGGATGITISPWTLAFCLFIFYSLALVKRFGELRALPDHQGVTARRGYQKGDLPVVAALGASSGVLSVVVFSLYISGPEVRLHYRSPAFLWLACPVILYWFGRLWVLANRGVVAEDPLVFSLRDKVGYLAAVCIGVIWLLASVCS
jgi:4-hydroxybenzoate polyprenyltransferase